MSIHSYKNNKIFRATIQHSRKAILINAETQTVEQVDIPDNNYLDTYYALLKCDCMMVVEIAVQRNHSLYLY